MSLSVSVSVSVSCVRLCAGRKFGSMTSCRSTMTAVIGPLAISAFFLDPVIYSGVTKRSSLTNMRPWRLRVNSEREVCRSLDMKASTIKVEVHGFSLDHHCVQVCFLTRLIAPAVLSPAHLALSRACLASRYRHCHHVLQRNVRSANPTNWSLTLCVLAPATEIQVLGS